MNHSIGQLELATERLVLKVLDENSADLILDYYERNREFLAEWEPLKGPEFFTLGYQQETLRKESVKVRNGEALRVWLFKKADPSPMVIGSIGLNNIVYGAFLSCHLGYKLDQNEINRGYTTEAINKVIEYAFISLGLHRVEANIMPHNARSMRVVEKLGFYNEGLAKKYLRINGIWEDHIHMVLLNSAMD